MSPLLEKRLLSEATILFLAANPISSGRLRLDEEAREIEQRIQMRGCRIALSLRTRWAVQPLDLLNALNEDRPAIVHFSGHGAGAPGLMLQDDQGRPTMITGQALQGLFRALKDDIRIVVLNACYSEEQALLISEFIDCVIGMHQSINDTAARVFSAYFYSALAHGRDVQNSFDQGLVAIEMERLGEQDVPRLLVRKGVNASEVSLAHPAGPKPVTATRQLPASAPCIRIEWSEFQRCRFVIKLEGSLADMNGELLGKLTDLLREHSGDLTLVIESIKAGSIRLTIATTPAGRARLVKLIDAGELVELAGIEILGFEEIASGLRDQNPGQDRLRQAPAQRVAGPDFYLVDHHSHFPDLPEARLGSVFARSGIVGLNRPSSQTIPTNRRERNRALVTAEKRTRGAMIVEQLPVLRTMARRLCRNESDAEDLVQDTIERALRVQALPSSVTASQWLIKMLRNQFIDRARSKAQSPGGSELRVREAVSDDLVQEASLDAPPWDGLTMDDVRDSLADLPADLRVVFEMSALQGLSHDDIGAKLGIAKATVGTRMYRGRKQLRLLLKRKLAKATDEPP